MIIENVIDEDLFTISNSCFLQDLILCSMDGFDFSCHLPL